MLEKSKPVKYISLGPYIFIRYLPESSDLQPPNCDSGFYPIYNFKMRDKGKMTDLSFPYFLSNLLDKLTDGELRERYWFLYPAVGGKEVYKCGTACL